MKQEYKIVVIMTLLIFMKEKETQKKICDVGKKQ